MMESDEPLKPLIGSGKVTYESRRDVYKVGKFFGIISFTKSTIGMGLLMNQYFFTQTGLILSIIMTISTCALIAYSLNVVLEIAN